MNKDGNLYLEKAESIFSDNKYMCIGTSTKKGRPWVTPVLYVYDEEYRVYFLSAIDSLHAENIKENSEVSIAIFNSEQKIGSSDGVQARGECSMVEEEEIEKAITLYCEKVFPGSDIKPTERYEKSEYLGASEFRFFRIDLSEIYVTGEDRRVRVDLREES